MVFTFLAHTFEAVNIAATNGKYDEES